MTMLEEGVQVLKVAADKHGNEPAQAILDRLTQLETENRDLHDINSELNAQLHELRQQILKQPAGWPKLFGEQS